MDPKGLCDMSKIVDTKFFRSQGYVVVPEIVSERLIDPVCQGIEKFCGIKLDDSSTWSSIVAHKNGLPELNGSGMVELYHHPSMWALRQIPEIYSVFADLWKQEALWVSIDRCNLNTPQRSKDDFGGFVHWDVDTSVEPLPFGLQGFVALTDCDIGGGGFHCVPGMPDRLGEWIKTQPYSRDPFRPDLSGLEVVEVPVRKGDLLVWNSLLPHGTAVNTSNQPRLVQYLSMAPAQEENLVLKNRRVHAWRNRIAPEGDAFPGDPRGWEKQKGTTADLNPLGRKLLGLDSWQISDDESPQRINCGSQKSDSGVPGF